MVHKVKYMSNTTVLEGVRGAGDQRMVLARPEACQTRHSVVMAALDFAGLAARTGYDIN